MTAKEFGYSLPCNALEVDCHAPEPPAGPPSMLVWNTANADGIGPLRLRLTLAAAGILCAQSGSRLAVGDDAP